MKLPEIILLEDELPPLMQFVPIIDEAGEIIIYRRVQHVIDGEAKDFFNMRDPSGENSPNNNLRMIAWIKMPDINLKAQEVKGNATQQGFPEYLTTLAHQYATDSEWGYPDDKAGRWMFEVVKQVFKDGYCRALTDNSLLPEKLNSEQGVQVSDTTMPNQGTEPSPRNSFTEEDLLELNEQLRQELEQVKKMYYKVDFNYRILISRISNRELKM